MTVRLPFLRITLSLLQLGIVSDPVPGPACTCSKDVEEASPSRAIGFTSTVREGA